MNDKRNTCLSKKFIGIQCFMRLIIHNFSAVYVILVTVALFLESLTKNAGRNLN